MRRILMTLFAISTNLIGISHSYATDPVATAPEPMEVADADSYLVRKKGIDVLLHLLSQYRSTGKHEDDAEEAVLYRLVDSYQELAAIEFRLAHRHAGVTNTQTDLSRYHQLMEESIGYAVMLTKDYPQSQFASQTYYLMAKAHKEINEDANAITDYETLIDKYPNERTRPIAILSLSDLLVDKKDYANALKYLALDMTDQSLEYYFLAADRTAWVYFYKNDIPTALHYLSLKLESLGKYLERSADHDTFVSRTNLIAQQKEKILSNVATFYAVAFKNKVPTYDIGNAVSVFQKYSPGDALGKMLVQFTYFLRSQGYDSELVQLKLQVLKLSKTENVPLPRDVLEMLIVIFENQLLNRHQLPLLVQTSSDISDYLVKDINDEKYKNKVNDARKAITLAIDTIQQKLQKRKGGPEAQQLSTALKVLYHIAVNTAGSDIASQSRVHFNLAEIEAEQKNYKEAVNNYMWIISKETNQKDLIFSARLGAISTRYEELKTAGIAPTDIQPHAFEKSKKTALSQDTKDWISWVDLLDVTTAKPENIQKKEFFEFQINRMLYNQGFTQESFDRIWKFITLYPKSEYVSASISLIIDTYLAGMEWQQAHDTATRFLTDMHWTDAQFKTKLQQIIDDTNSKLMEDRYAKNKDYAALLVDIPEYLKSHSSSNHQKELLELAANCALALGQNEKALDYLTRQKSIQGPANDSQTYLITLATVAEEKYDFKAASDAYFQLTNVNRSVASSDQKDLQPLIDKALVYTALTGDRSALEKILKSKNICSDHSSQEIADACELLTVLNEMKNADAQTSVSIAGMHKKSTQASGIWAIIALNKPKSLSYADRIRMLSQLENLWSSSGNKLYPFAEYQYLPFFFKNLTETMSTIRPSLRKASPLKLQKQAIDRRVKQIAEVESIMERYLDAPWVEAHRLALVNIAGLYHDFVEDISGIRAPRGLSADDKKAFTDNLTEAAAPFKKKAEDLDHKAQDLNFGINSSVANNFLEHVVPSSNWNSEDLLQKQLRTAFLNGNLPLTAYFLHEVQKKKTLSEPLQHLFWGACLSKAGAYADSHFEFDKAAHDLDGKSNEQLHNELEKIKHDRQIAGTE